MVASAIPLIALIIGWILTDISPFTMLSQMNAEGNTYWNNAFFSGWNWMLQGRLFHEGMQYDEHDFRHSDSFIDVALAVSF